LIEGEIEQIACRTCGETARIGQRPDENLQRVRHHQRRGAPTITTIKCNLCRSVCRKPRGAGMPTGATVTSAWIMMSITLTMQPTRN